MVVTKTFEIDLVRNQIPSKMSCMAGDANSREIRYILFADGMSYNVPSGVNLKIAYEKPDGKKGFYSQLSNGTDAYEINENRITITINADILAKPGKAFIQPILYDSDGNTLSVWPTEIDVCYSINK